ncbi:MAG: cysteine-rich CWC family protein [Chitinophagaceae bacterium]|nr:cysteine-rich CWC family protein [Chitinophagaceae bacterium]MCB9046681.1 cysteine-rich CWC family protein [Chitinophagales bacterium]
MATKQCSKCNTPFACTAPIAGCWCEQYTVPIDTLQHLKSTYDNCLCPDCLSEYATGNAPAETSPTNKE